MHEPNQGKKLGIQQGRNAHYLMAAMAAIALLASVADYITSNGDAVELPDPAPPGTLQDIGPPATGPFGLTTVDAGSSLPLIQLILSRNDVAHFDRIYSRLEGGSPDPQFYRDHNTWRKALLRFRETLYNVPPESSRDH